MRFIDEAQIEVVAGHGGPGSVSFRRETFEPRGGPDGGDGGAGGDVIFVASVQLGTLQDFRYRRAYKAEAGHHGQGTNKAGRDGEDVRIRVPVGTLIHDAETGELLKEFLADGEEWMACKGGRGGKGNSHFVSSTHQAPRFAQPGEDGEKRTLKVELKLLADAAIIGFPNAGKSTLISRISAARPKVADYAFTTLVPNLGVVSLPDYKSFVVADIPGLIEGAHRGLGLGHKFLRHIERTSLFVHLLDGAQVLEEATNPLVEDSFGVAIQNCVDRYEAIRKELGLFNEALLNKPEVVVLNKLDVLNSDPELVDRIRKALRERIANIRGQSPEGQEPWVISAVTGAGVQSLILELGVRIERNRLNRKHTGPEAFLAGQSGQPVEPLTSSVQLPDDLGLRRAR
jgi:GTP-binding protein